jgi:uncharacterized protein YbjT (DUF2867 family)
MILVTGATGNIGSELVRALARPGEPVRALTRSAKNSTDDVEYVTGDLNDPGSMGSALAGVRGLFLLPGYPGMSATLAEAKKAGVQHVVLVSSSSVEGGEPGNAVTRYMMDSEQAVTGSGLPWTFLRSFGFMSNALQWLPQLQAGDVVRAPWPDVPIAVIDPQDIAAVAAVALTSPGHAGRAYTLSGPEPLRPADRVAILGEVLGRPLTFDGQPDDEARAEMSQAMPAEYVAAFFRFYSDGTLDESRVRPDVRDVTGRPPRTFRDWARAHAAAFTSKNLSAERSRLRAARNPPAASAKQYRRLRTRPAQHHDRARPDGDLVADPQHRRRPGALLRGVEGVDLRPPLQPRPAFADGEVQLLPPAVDQHQEVVVQQRLAVRAGVRGI